MTDDRSRLSVFDFGPAWGMVADQEALSSVVRLPSSETAAACASLLPRIGRRRTEDRQIDPSSVFCPPSSGSGLVAQLVRARA